MWKSAAYHGLFAKRDGDVSQRLKDGLVVLHNHFLDHLDILEGGQPELGNSSDVFALFFLLLFRFLELDLLKMELINFAPFSTKLPKLKSLVFNAIKYQELENGWVAPSINFVIDIPIVTKSIFTCSSVTRWLDQLEILAMHNKEKWPKSKFWMPK